MPKRSFSTLEEFKANLHQDGATLLDFTGGKVPSIFISQRDYEEIKQKLYNKMIRAEPILDIFYDGSDVFVDIQLKFAGTDFDKNYLLYANDMMEFFEALAETGRIALLPQQSAYSNSESVFMIQLAKREGAEKALEIIRANSDRHARS